MFRLYLEQIIIIISSENQPYDNATAQINYVCRESAQKPAKDKTLKIRHFQLSLSFDNRLPTNTV